MIYWFMVTSFCGLQGFVFRGYLDSFIIPQLQRLIHLMLESLTSLMESLTAIIQKEKLEEYSRFPLDDLIPSLCKIRKLAGMVSVFRLSLFLKVDKDLMLSRVLFFFLFQISLFCSIILRITRHALEIHYDSLGERGTSQLWLYNIRGMHICAAFNLVAFC